MKKNNALSGQRAFGLSDILIVVTIAALVAAVAYPSYQTYVERIRRADAQSVLVQAAQFMERFYSENLRYDETTGGTDVTLPSGPAEATIDSAPKFYDVTLSSVSSSAFTLRATPKNARAGDGYLEYTSTGQKRWDRDNNGSIAASETCWNHSC